MSFAWPHLLWLLVLPYGLLAWELRGGPTSAASSRSSILKAEATPRQLSLVDRHAAARRIRPWLCAGLALAVVALARPQWGRLDEPVFDQSREILIALDLSRSMLTPDVNPSRLERAKLLIQSLLDSLAGERVGLVIFSGTAFLQAPMSADYEILREFLPSLGPDYLPVGGTNYGAMLGVRGGRLQRGHGGGPLPDRPQRRRGHRRGLALRASGPGEEGNPRDRPGSRHRQGRLHPRWRRRIHEG